MMTFMSHESQDSDKLRRSTGGRDNFLTQYIEAAVTVCKDMVQKYE
jgi:hypothetical protein